MSLVSKILELPQHLNIVGSLVRSAAHLLIPRELTDPFSASRPFFASQGMTELGVARTYFVHSKYCRAFEHIYRVTRTLKAEG